VPQEFKLPEVGEGIESGTVVAVLVKGRPRRGRPAVLELETDKAVVEVPLDRRRRRHQGARRANAEAKIGQVVLTVDEGRGAPPRRRAERGRRRPPDEPEERPSPRGDAERRTASRRPRPAEGGDARRRPRTRADGRRRGGAGGAPAPLPDGAGPRPHPGRALGAAPGARAGRRPAGGRRQRRPRPHLGRRRAPLRRRGAMRAPPPASRAARGRAAARLRPWGETERVAHVGHPQGDRAGR
jgi:pyruvate/2-oxoglutarate dehydrogenase complex dihydrolipoamide acyltransferase (E2) component